MNVAPKTYLEVLAFAQAAQVVSWARDLATLSCYFDDVAQDRRTCLNLRIKAGQCGLVEIRTVSGYDAKKNVWRVPCAPNGTIVLPSRHGLKALQVWITAQAIAQTGWSNPITFSRYLKTT